MKRVFIPLALLLAASPASAQDYSALQSKIERLERDMTFLQRQVYQADPNAASVPTPAAGAGASSVQMMQIQEEMRALRGQFEQLDFRIRKLEQDAESRAKDIEFRLQQLESAGSAAVPSAAVVAPTPETAATPAAAAAPASAAPAAGYDINATDPDAARSGARYEPAPEAAATPAKSFTTPREHYNHAFKLLNDAKYADASASFSSFIQKHPKDALVPNAYYWMGESYYARRNFSKAAEGFRKGYETAPKGQKAPDNLLKLSLSLANLKRKEEACIVLKQIGVQYGKTAKTTAAKAASESKRLAC